MEFVRNSTAKIIVEKKTKLQPEKIWSAKERKKLSLIVVETKIPHLAIMSKMSSFNAPEMTEMLVDNHKAKEEKLFLFPLNWELFHQLPLFQLTAKPKEMNPF